MAIRNRTRRDLPTLGGNVVEVLLYLEPKRGIHACAHKSGMHG